MLDFSSLTPLDSINPKGQSFRIKWRPKARNKFLFSDEVFSLLQLQDNSFDILPDRNNKVLYLAICPGNEGKFMRGRDGKKKGKSLTSTTLQEVLESFNFEGDALDVIAEGVHDGKSVYRLVMAGTKEESNDEPVEAVKETPIAEEPQETVEENSAVEAASEMNVESDDENW
mgnify:CR=1 FL=1